MKTRTGTLKVFLSGPLLIGGYTHAGRAVDTATARDRHGRPVIPSTALKGAWREAMVRLRSDCCLPWDPCREKVRCMACAVFGPSGVDRPNVVEEEASARTDDAGWFATGLRLSDATSSGDTSYHTRHGVSIDRYTGAKVDGRLFRREMAVPRKGEAVFEADVEARLTDKQLAALVQSAALVDGIGNSQSRGVGHVRMELLLADHTPSRRDYIRVGVRQGADASVEIEALEPLHLGGLQDGGNVKTSERVVPGNTLLGALVAAARRVGIDKEQAGRVLGQGGLSASDLLPARQEYVGLPVPAPRTALQCPSCEDVVVDYVLAEAAARALARGGMDAGEPPACPTCASEGRSSTMKPGLSTSVYPGVEIRSRVVTRLARDPATRSAATGLLHLREQLEPDGLRFRGTLGGLTEEALEMLQRIAHEPVFVGGGRTRGLGRVKVHLSRLPAAPSPDERLASFREEAVRALSGLEGLLGWQPAELVHVLARTPLDLGDTATVPQGLNDALFDGRARLVACWQRTTHRSGWDDWAGKLHSLRAVVAPGSVYLFVVDGVDPGRLRDAEIHGVGNQTRLGLGRLHIGSPLPPFTGA